MKFRKSIFYTVVIMVATVFAVGVAYATALQENPALTQEGQGLNFVAEGIGLEFLGSGTATVTVDIGGSVQLALLYWAGRDFPCQQDVSGNCLLTGADQDLIFNGSPISGLLVGEEINAAGGTQLTNNIGYRADVTAIVKSAGTGIRSFDIQDGDTSNNFHELDGATLFIIYTDGADLQSYKIVVFEGLDYAFVRSNPDPAAKVTEPVTFTYDATTEARNADLLIAVGSADEESRCDLVTISDNPDVVNQLNATDGAQWDNFQTGITIPAGTASTTVQVFSPEECSTGTSESLLWELGALRVPLPAPPDCSIGDFVWEDADRDGCQGAEEGIEGVVVKLFDGCFGDEIATTTTDATGFYKFEGLECEKDYGIQFVDDPTDIYEQTIADQMCVDGDPDESDKEDSDCGDEGKVCVPASSLPPGTFNDTIDCGYVCEGEIGDRVWLDTNGFSGCQDPDEPGIGGVTVNLFEVENCPDVQGQIPFMTTTTDGQGKYLFGGLCPGDYRVTFEDPLERDNTIANLGCDDSDLIGGGGDGSDSDCGTDDECVTLTVANFVDETIDCGKVQPCELAVEKFCTEPPTAVLGCTDKIVATTLRYIGPNMANATVEVDPDKSPTEVYSNVDLVSGVTILRMPTENDFTVDARPDENELGSKTKIRINGVEEVIHTSCSTPYVAGLPAPLDNPKGDPSPNWFVENFKDKDGNFSAVTDPELKKECTVFAADGASCADGKPTSLTFIYTGDDCDASDNDQGHKAKCEGDPEDAQPVQLVYVGKKASKFTVTPADESIMVGDEVTITTTDKFEANTKLEVQQGGTSLQDLEIHTSCSQPLAEGDQFGSLLLSQFVPKGGAVVTDNILYTYRVKNNGAAPVTVDVFDDQLGPIAAGLVIPANDQVELTEGALLTETTTNTVTVTDVDAADCFAADSVTVTVKEPPTPPCTTKVQAMKLKYTGTTSLTNVEFDPDKGDSVTYATVNPGDVLSMPAQNDWTIDATVSGEQELGAKTKIRVNGVLTEIIHTSCSAPFAAGAPAPLDGGSPGVPGNPDPDKGDPSPNWFVEDFMQK